MPGYRDYRVWDLAAAVLGLRARDVMQRLKDAECSGRADKNLEQVVAFDPGSK